VANAAPDGYTLLTAPDTVYTVNPYLYKSSRVNAQRDLMPIMRLATGSLALACHPSVGATTLDQLVALSKTKPMTYASGGNGSPAHLATEYLKSLTGLQMTHVPYRGPAPAAQAILASEVSCGLIISNVVVPLALERKVTVLLSTGVQRLPKLPSVPTAREAGLSDFVVDTFLTLSAPPKTPDPIINRLSQAFSAALQDPQVTQRLVEAGITPAFANQAEVRKEIDARAARWSKVIEAIGLRLD
jgi:tripartite-type tricarboxylate transporter receptor subunit TctC